MKSSSNRTLGIDPKLPPIEITSARFDDHVDRKRSPRAKASEMEHPLRYHIRKHLDEDPVFYQKLSERLRNILETSQERWQEMAEDLNLATLWTRPMGATSRTTYNSLSAVLSVIDPLQRRTTFSYDAMGRQTEAAYPDDDAGGWVASIGMSPSHLVTKPNIKWAPPAE